MLYDEISDGSVASAPATQGIDSYGEEAWDVSSGDRSVADAGCQDCGAALHGPYCSACGLEQRPLDPTFRELLSEAWQSVTNLEGRIFATLRMLVTAPGFLTQEYLAGRRRRWMNPVRLYLAVSVAYFALIALTGESGMNLNVGVTGGTVQEQQAQLEELGYESAAELDAAAAQAVRVWLPRAMFVLVPFLALLVHVLRRGSGRRYARQVIFSLHVHAAWFAAFATLGVAGALLGGTFVGAFLTASAFVYAAVYLALALRRTYGVGLLRATAETVLVGGVYWLALIAILVALILPLVFA